MIDRVEVTEIDGQRIGHIKRLSILESWLAIGYVHFDPVSDGIRSLPTLGSYDEHADAVAAVKAHGFQTA